MAGIGPTSLKSRNVQQCAERMTGLTATANELEIFYNICVGKVYFRDSTRTLYFVDSPVLSVTETLVAVFKAFDETPLIRQLYMDAHNLIKASSCIVLDATKIKPVLVALRMRGIHIDKS